MTQERQRILKLVEEGKLTAEEGARLMDALDSAEGTPARGGKGRERASFGSSEGRIVRIRVVEAQTGIERVNFGIPLALARLAGTLVPAAQRMELERHGIHFGDLISAVESGETGTMAEVRDNDRGERVEISIE